MTSIRPRPTPGDAGPPMRERAADERARIAAEGRTTRRIAVLALVVAVLGTGLAAARLLLPGEDRCQALTWGVTPKAADLPAGWSVGATQYDINRQQVTLLGPPPADQGSSRAVTYATITCFPEGAATAVARSEQAARAAGQTVISRDDLGDGGFSAVDEGGSTFLQLRHGPVVVYLAASSDARADEVDALASAYDIALGGDGGAIALGTPGPGGSEAPGGSDAATAGAPGDSPAASDDLLSESPAAPDLEARLPTTVGDTTLTVSSAVGSDIFGDDQASRAITAALRTAGKDPSDLRVAQAYDATEGVDLTMLAVAVEGLPVATVRTLMLDSWLAANGAGVTQERVTVAGRQATRVDYGDDGTLDWVLVDGDTVIVVTTATPELAAAAIAALPE